jgi:heme/copper-type cytochrome/quinol oxidase subunit 2
VTINRKHVLALIVVLMMTAFVAALNVPQARAMGGQTRDLYLVVKPDLGGDGYDRFSPGNFIVMQGDRANITVRNPDNEGFAFSIENYANATIQPGIQSGGEVEPVDTRIPIFNATTPGIFRMSSVGHAEMEGYFIVLPQDWSKYGPVARNRAFNILSIPDFGGDGYDKFLPATVVVNQGDKVNITVRNTDDMPHGFAVPAFGINQAVQPAEDLPDGSVQPVETRIPVFTADSAGVFEFLCTVPCGPGHIEMVGTIVVLPKGGEAYNPTPNAAYRYLTVKADYAGDGYDKFVPGVMVVNQGDLVYIKVRNTDDMYHGFALADYNIRNETIAPAIDTANGTIPTDTYITNFIADKPGIYTFFCTIYCGPGHYQMIGSLVVLPSTGTAGIQPAGASAGGVSMILALAVAAGALIVGFVLGSIIRLSSKRR